MGNKKLKFTIISGAPNQNIFFLKQNIDKKSFVIAADYGYKTCSQAGIIPDLIIGDFDSSEFTEANCDIISFSPVKDDTDTLCCVKEAIKRGADEIEIFCGIGSRLDHTYANILCLEYCRKNNVKAFLINENNKALIIDKKLVIEKSEYKYFSLFAFLGDVSGLTIKGAAYELDNKSVSAGDSFGVSNEFKENTVEIELKKGLILLIFSND